MTDRQDLAEAFERRRPDPFEDLRNELAALGPGEGAAPSAVDAVGFAAFAAATRASYVLSLGDMLTYAAFRVADGFGSTGRIDLVISDPQIASLAEKAQARHDLHEAMRIHRGSPGQVVPGINGPFDLAIVALTPREIVSLYEPIVRLVRSGGSLLFDAWPLSADEDSPEARAQDELLELLGNDARLFAHLPATESPFTAVRRR